MVKITANNLLNMAKITGNDLETFKVLAVSGGVLLLALSGTTVLRKFLSIKFQNMICNLKLVQSNISRQLPIALVPSASSITTVPKHRPGLRCSASLVSLIGDTRGSSGTLKTLIGFEADIDRLNLNIMITNGVHLHRKRFQKSTCPFDRGSLEAWAVQSSFGAVEEAEDERENASVSSAQVQVAAPSLSGIHELVPRKKKVHFAANVVEPAGDNRKYRQNPRSSQSYPTSTYANEKSLLRRLRESEVGHARCESGSMVVGIAESLHNDVSISSQIDLRRCEARERSSKIKTLCGSKLPANRIALYTGMYRDRFRRAPF